MRRYRAGIFYWRFVIGAFAVCLTGCPLWRTSQNLDAIFPYSSFVGNTYLTETNLILAEKPRRGTLEARPAPADAIRLGIAPPAAEATLVGLLPSGSIFQIKTAERLSREVPPAVAFWAEVLQAPGAEGLEGRTIDVGPLARQDPLAFPPSLVAQIDEPPLR